MGLRKAWVGILGAKERKLILFFIEVGRGTWVRRSSHVLGSKLRRSSEKKGLGSTKK